ncbi:MAG: heme lyase CcmF/NrfE family subunit [Alphaproteobacteria bacterium]
MVAELANSFLILVLILDFLSINILSLKYFKAHTEFYRINKLLANLQFIFISLSFFSLIYCFYISDFSVVLVAEYSSTKKPLIYKLAGSWGNHEGSMLLWLWEFHLINFIFNNYSKIEDNIKSNIITVQSVISLLIGLFIYNSSNPFIQIDPIAEGRGLNPLLQDIGLAIHPPILYLGYVTLSLSFSYSIVTLIKGEFCYKSIGFLKPYINISWVCLTLGITLGSWWAYRELGWGGFWFWDPVENVSLMPWLSATALIHMINVVIKRKILASWFVFLSILSFSLNLFGIFIVRSGILTSVHSFASDSSRGSYLLMILMFVTTTSFSIFAFRAHKINTYHRLMLLTKEGSVLINNLLLITASFIILIGTLYPLIYQFFNKQISVGEGYFTHTFIPFFIFILFIMGASSEFKWKESTKFPVNNLIELFTAILLAIYISYNTSGLEFKYFAALTASLFLIINMMRLIIRKLILHKKAGKIILTSYIMLVAHLGLGIAGFSITINAYNQLENNEYMNKGDVLEIGSYKVKLNKIDYSKKYNYYIRKAEFVVLKANKELKYLYPEFRFYELEQTTTYESDIYHSLFGDIYIVIGEEKDNKLAVKLYFKPMISYIWLASIIMCLAVIAEFGKWSRVK